MSEKKSGKVVDGFIFYDEKTAETAARECEGIKYIRQKTDMDNAEMVLQVYHKILDQKLFQTPVGMGYLRELQEYLMSVPYIRNEDIRPLDMQEIIRLETTGLENEKQGKNKKKEKKEPKAGKESEPVNPKLRTRARISIVLNVLFILAIAGMFAISLTSEHPNIINYENKILNKYASWEIELNEREQFIKLKEQELNLNTGEDGDAAQTGNPENNSSNEGEGAVPGQPESEGEGSVMGQPESEGEGSVMGQPESEGEGSVMGQPESEEESGE